MGRVESRDRERATAVLTAGRAAPTPVPDAHKLGAKVPSGTGGCARWIYEAESLARVTSAVGPIPRLASPAWIERSNAATGVFPTAKFTASWAQMQIEGVVRRVWHLKPALRGGISYARLRAVLHRQDLIGMDGQHTEDDTDAESGRPVCDAEIGGATAEARDKQNRPHMPPPRQPPPPPPQGFDFAAVDTVDIDDLAIAFCRTNRHILPSGKAAGAQKDAENRLLRAHGVPLAKITERYENRDESLDLEDDIELERALKWHLIQHEALMRIPNSGKQAAKRRQMAAQLHLWETDGQRALIDQLLADRTEAKAEMKRRAEEYKRPEVAGGRTDTERLRDMAALNRLHDAMMMLQKNSGVLDGNDPGVRKQLRGKHPQRGELEGCRTTSMPTPSEYGMPPHHMPGDDGYITVSVELIQARARRLKGQRAKGPGGDYNEHMAPYARVHPSETPEAQVMKDYAFFVELFVNARLPAWYYRLSAAARLVPLLKPEWDGVTLPPPARPIAVGGIERRFCCGILVEIHAQDFADFLGPDQMAVGIKASAEKLTFGIRAHHSQPASQWTAPRSASTSVAGTRKAAKKSGNSSRRRRKPCPSPRATERRRTGW